MRRIRDLVGLLILGAAFLAGCAASESQVRPPKPPEEFNAPPPNDPRYSGPVEYPREVMGQDMLLKRAKDASNAKTPPSTMGGPRSSTGRMPGQ